MFFWTVGGNRSTQGKPTRTRGEQLCTESLLQKEYDPFFKRKKLRRFRLYDEDASKRHPFILHSVWPILEIGSQEELEEKAGDRDICPSIANPPAPENHTNKNDVK